MPLKNCAFILFYYRILKLRSQVSKVSLEGKTMAQGLWNMVGLLYQAHMKGGKCPCQSGETCGGSHLKLGGFGGKPGSDVPAADV